MDNLNIPIIIIVIILILAYFHNYCYINNTVNKEYLQNINDYNKNISRQQSFDYLKTYTYSPFWNSSRFTRNMSYDLRGDIMQHYYYDSPFWNSSLFFNKF